MILQVGTQEIVQVLYSGVSFGMILVMTSAGLSLIFGLMGVVNFAHGELYAVGAYGGFVVYSSTGNFIAAIAAAALAGTIVGTILETSVIRPLYDRDPIYQVPVTFGAAIVITETIKLVLGSSPKPFGVPSYLSGSFTILGVKFGLYRSFLIVAGIVLVSALWAFLVRTRYGLIIRAAIFDTEMVESMGYDVSRAYTLLFGIGAAYAAIAGVLVAPLFGVTPQMGNQIIIIAFIVVVVGGLGSFRGVIVSGLLIGVTLSFGRTFVPVLSEAIPFLAMAAIIAVRPQGLFGIEGVFTD